SVFGLEVGQHGLVLTGVVAQPVVLVLAHGAVRGADLVGALLDVGRRGRGGVAGEGHEQEAGKCDGLHWMGSTEGGCNRGALRRPRDRCWRDQSASRPICCQRKVRYSASMCAACLLLAAPPCPPSMFS